MNRSIAREMMSYVKVVGGLGGRGYGGFDLRRKVQANLMQRTCESRILGRVFRGRGRGSARGEARNGWQTISMFAE